jgi:hypothetical protein
MHHARLCCDASKEFTVKPTQRTYFGALFLILVPGLAQADRASDIRAQLQEFDTNPARAMKKIPTKYDAITGKPVTASTAFSAADIKSGGFVTKKDSLRKTFCTTAGGARVCLSDVLPGRAPFADNDLAENLVDNGSRMLRTLEAMERKGLMSAQLAETPWSDNYWPIYQGVLANRYADGNFPNSNSWKRNHDYVMGANTDLSSILGSGDASSIDNLSPAEKYDLLMGDTQGTLTKAMWAEGQGYYRSNGKVETWMGICHGWAPASYMVPRPAHTVELTAADGKTQVTFYPSDIKGLASLLWAKSSPESRFIGSRCNDKDPSKDSNGRITSDDCFDTNPGTWHMAVVNQIGVSKRSFVIDATYDYEVWNQPVYSYSYTYFNPQTGQPASSLDDAKVDMSDFRKDKFKKYRSDNAASVVGIAMDMSYVQETNPSHTATDTPESDSVKTVRYLYDLELDANNKIIGGEWYENAHPDFLWTPDEDSQALTSGDRFATGRWNGSGTAPDSWQKAAASTSRSARSPLGKVVDLLSKMAHH